MKPNSAILLVLGLAVGAAGPLYAAGPSSNQQGQPGMANDSAQRNYQEALANCQKKTGAAHTECVRKAAQEKCKDLTGTAKSKCMKDASGKHPGSSGDTPDMRNRQDRDGMGMPGGAPLNGPVDGSSRQQDYPGGSPNGSSSGSPSGSSPSGSPTGSPSGSSPSGSSSGSPGGSYN